MSNWRHHPPLRDGCMEHERGARLSDGDRAVDNSWTLLDYGSIAIVDD